MVHRHYRTLVTKEEAKRYWAITAPAASRD
jgi:hypothetical protein